MVRVAFLNLVRGGGNNSAQLVRVWLWVASQALGREYRHSATYTLRIRRRSSFAREKRRLASSSLNASVSVVLEVTRLN